MALTHSGQKGPEEHLVQLWSQGRLLGDRSG